MVNLCLRIVVNEGLNRWTGSQRSGRAGSDVAIGSIGVAETAPGSGLLIRSIRIMPGGDESGSMPFGGPDR